MLTEYIDILTKMPTKNADKFECKECHFICRKQSNYVKHLVTSKHKKLTNNENDNKNAKLFECVLCSKQYFSRVGLWKHDKKCRNIFRLLILFQTIHEHRLVQTLIFKYDKRFFYLIT